MIIMQIKFAELTLKYYFFLIAWGVSKVLSYQDYKFKGFLRVDVK